MPFEDVPAVEFCPAVVWQTWLCHRVFPTQLPPLRAYHLDGPGFRSIKGARRPCAHPLDRGCHVDRLIFIPSWALLVRSLLLTRTVKSAHQNQRPARGWVKCPALRRRWLAKEKPQNETTGRPAWSGTLVGMSTFDHRCEQYGTDRRSAPRYKRTDCQPTTWLAACGQSDARMRTQQPRA